MNSELLHNNAYLIDIKPNLVFGFDVTVIDSYNNKIILLNANIRISNINILLGYINERIVDYEKNNNIRFC